MLEHFVDVYLLLPAGYPQVFCPFSGSTLDVQCENTLHL